MRSRGIGSLLVIGDQRSLLGLLTERDIVAAFATYGPDAAQLRVDSVMQQDVPTCHVSDTLEHVMATMTELRTRHVLVSSDESLIGILSIGDIVKRRLTELEEENKLALSYIWSGRGRAGVDSTASPG